MAYGGLLGLSTALTLAIVFCAVTGAAGALAPGTYTIRVPGRTNCGAKQGLLTVSTACSTIAITAGAYSAAGTEEWTITPVAGGSSIEGVDVLLQAGGRGGCGSYASVRASCAGKIVLNDLVPGSAKQYWTLERQQSGRYAIRPKACPGTYLFLGPRCDQQLARVVPTSRVYMLNPPCQYSVTQGDTLEALAPVFSTTVSALLALNPGVDPAALYPGQQLATCTLAPCQHSIVAGDTLFALSLKYSTSVAALQALNPSLDPLNLQIGTVISLPCPSNGGGDVSPSPTPSPSGAVLPCLTQALWSEMFKHTEDPACSPGFYTWSAFIEAAKTFPAFGSSADDATNRREVAAFLGQISHETTGGWPTAPDGPQAWGLCFKEELCAPNCASYCAAGAAAQYPCAAGKSYHGRGPIQLSYNFNYGQAGSALGLDLLGNPDLVTSSAVVAFRTALWFWMTPQPPKPSAHDVMTGRYQPSGADTTAGRLPGFGSVTNIVNGVVECGKGATAAGQDRIAFFQRYAAILGVGTGANLDCYAQQPWG